MIPVLGEMLAIVAAACYAFGSVAATKKARENGGRGNAVLLSIVLTAVLSGGLWLLVGPSLPPLDADLWIGVAIFVLAGILATVLGRIFFFRSIELAGAIETGLIRRLIPVFAAVLAILLLGETLTAASALAFVLVFAAFALVVVASRGGAAAEDADEVRASGERNTGRLLAMLSAASYGGSYVTRKFAMRWLPDPLLGAFIGAVAAFACFAAAAPFSAEYRREFAAVLRRLTGWQLIAAASISLGQTAIRGAPLHDRHRRCHYRYDRDVPRRLAGGLGPAHGGPARPRLRCGVNTRYGRCHCLGPCQGPGLTMAAHAGY